MIITELDNRCHQSHITTNSELFFDFLEFEITLSIEFNDGSELSILENYMSVSEYLSAFQRKGVRILSINITHHEYLGDRVDISEYFEPQSISFKMFSFLRVLNKIDKDIVLDYGLHIDEIDPFCSTQPNYFFKIELNIDETLIIKIVDELENTKINHVPLDFYWVFYNRNVPFDDNSSLKILTNNTKTRRLGYLKLLSEFIKIEKKIPESKINRKFEKYSTSILIEDQLLDYKDDKGRIKITKSGISAQPYITLAENLDLLTKINNIYSEGKRMKVYRLVKEKINQSKSENVFDLSYFDRLFFIERILEEDFLYLSILLEFLFIKESTSFDELKAVFQSKILSRLNYYLKELGLKESVKRQIQKIRKRVLSWKNPDVYLEHIIMPRINWLVDLDFVIFNRETKKFEISDIGEEFMTHICCWYDIESAIILNPKEYLARFIQHSFAYSNDTSFKIDEANIESLDSLIDLYINESFEHFKTLAPNRTTLSQAVNYAKYMTYINYGIPVEYQYIVNYLRKNKEKYIYKYQNQYKDGYIQKR